MGTAWRSPAALASEAAVLALLLPAHVQAATSAVNWEPESPLQSPPARTFAASVFDSKQNRVVLFGGWNGIVPLGDTCQFVGTALANLPPPVAHPATSNAAIAHLTVRGLLTVHVVCTITPMYT